MPDGRSIPLPIPKKNFSDWSGYTRVQAVQTVQVAGVKDVVDYCNYAVAHNQKVRALAHSHNWSPLVLPPNTARTPNVILLDTQHLTGRSAMVVGDRLHATFGTGTTLEAATAYLEKQTNGGASNAPGYSFLNMPTPGGLSLGGILAVGGHGTSVPVVGRAEPDLMGCLSNLIVSFKAVGTDPNIPGSKEYVVQEFDRSHPDASAFLVHLGRAFITEVTLAATPNYYLQLTNHFPKMSALMAPPSASSTSTLSSLLDAHGRVEAIWFPYADDVWVQCLDWQADRIEPQVEGPYNYPWMNSIPQLLSDMIKAALMMDPGLIEEGSQIEEIWTRANETGSLNGTARDLEIYLTDSTLRMGILGYALQVRRADVQAVAHEFYSQFTKMLAAYNKDGKWPVNGVVEVRCTTLDQQADLGIPSAQPPALAATHAVDPASSGVDTMLWLDVLTFPDTPSSSQFFADLEQWMIKTWHPRYPNRLRPEWSKGWAYTAAGPWTDDRLIKTWVPSVYNAAPDHLTFDWAKQTLAKYDRGNIFSNDFLAKLFS